jgi:hypothetical protein
MQELFDRLCGLVVRISGYRPRGPGSIPCATRFSVSLVSTIEKPLERKRSGSGLEIGNYGRKGSAALTPLYPQKLVLTSPKNGGRSVSIVRSRTQVTEFVSYESCEGPTWLRTH